MAKTKSDNVESAEHEKRFRTTLIDSIPNPVFYKDADGIYRECNPAFARNILGLPREEILGKSVYDLPQAIPADLADVYHEADMKLIREPGTQVYEAQVKYADGTRHDVVFNKATILDNEGEVQGMVGVILDITDRKQVEEHERHAQKLHLAAQVAQRLNAIVDIDVLLPEVVDQLQREFDLYHVHLYLLDQGTGELVMHTGSGEVGRELRARGHNIPLDSEQSLVARAARNRELVVVDDVSEEPGFMPNPLLPETKTEVAVPLVFGDRVLGVLDTQQDEAGYFTQSDLDVFTSLAGQIATAIETARLFEQRAYAEERARAILESTPVGITITKIPEGTVLYANPEFTDILGHEVDEIMGKAVPDFYADPAESEEVLALLLENDGALDDYELRAKRADGKEIWLSLSFQSIEFGETPASLAAFVDITEAKEAEEALLESEERFRSMAETMQDGLVIIEGREVVYVNERLTEITGYSSEELAKMSSFDYAAPEEGKRLKAAMLEAQGGKPIEELAFWIVRKDGERRYVRNRYSLMRRDGKIVGRYILVADETDEKLAEAERERFASRLEVASTIAGRVNEILDPDQLLEEVIPLLKERFGLYHVHVYTLDQDDGELTLRAGYGEAGRVMVEEGHAIPFDREQSLVARAARTGEPVLVNDVTEDPNFMPNPLLPDTKSEVAVPAIAGGEVLGVFDVQHDAVEYFTDADLEVFTTLADQIATAFHNAQVFAAQQRAEWAAQKSAENVRAIFNAVYDAIFIHDLDGAIIDVNDKMLEMYGVSRDEAAELDIAADYSGPDNPLETLPATWEQVVSGQPALFEWKARRPHDGTLFDAEVFLRRITMGEQGDVIMANIRDITERKRAEATIQESQEKFQTVADYTYDWEYWLGTDGEFVYVSPACERITGYAPEEFIEDAGLMERIVHPEDLEHALHQDLHDAEVHEEEFRVLTKDGEIRWIGHICQPVYGSDGAFLGRRASNRDITEQHAAELATRESERRLSTLMTNLPGMAYRMLNHPDWPAEFLSSGAQELTGYAPETLTGEEAEVKYGDLIHPEDRDRVWETVQEGLENRTSYETTYRLQTADGATKWVWEQGTGVYGSSGELLAIEGFISDITQQLAAEEALRENEERLSLALESGRVGIWEFWPLKDEVYFNPTYYTMLGYEPYELPQSLATWAELMHPEDAGRANEIVQSAIQAGEDFDLQFRMQTKEGGWRWIQANGYITRRTPEGMGERVIGTHADITERKRAEMERERFASRLEVASTIAGRVNEILDPDQLLEEVIPLLKERFGLYHVHVYTVNEGDGELILRAGYGEPGRVMVEEEHAIPLDREQSLVARAARSGEPVLVNDVTEDPNFMPNPLLPDTKSEVAVPAVAEGKVLGVFDVQHDEAGYFTDADLDVFTTLADQVATAFRNAQIFAEQQRLQEELSENERQLSEAMRIARMGYWEFDVATQTFTFNDNYYRTFHDTTAEEVGGYQMSAQEFAQRFVPPEDAPEVGKNIQMALEATDPDFQLETESRNLTIDGEERWVSVWLTIEKDEQGRTTKLYGVNQDVTERKQAERALQLTRASVENAGDAFFWFDADANFIDVSETTSRLLGYPHDELLEMSVFDIDPVFPREGWPHVREQIKEAGTLTLESQHRTKEGRTYPVQVTASYIEFAGEEVFFAAAKDITERKEAEQERERFTTRLGTAADIATEINTILDPDQLLEEVIPLLKERFGLYYVHVYTLDEESGELQLRAGYGEAGRQMVEEGHAIPLDREQSLVARAARTKEPVLVQDVTEEPGFMPNPLLPDTKSEVAVPAVSGDQVLGVFDVQHDEANYFTDADLDVFTTLASQIATAFQNARLFENVERNLAEAEINLRVSRRLAAAERVDEVLDVMVDMASFHPNAQVSLGLFMEPEDVGKISTLVRAEAFESGIPVLPEGTPFKFDEFAVLGHHASPDETFVTANLHTDERIDEVTRAMSQQTGAVSMAVIPVTSGDEWMGLYALSSREEGYFDDYQTLYLYESLARQGAVALRLARLYEAQAKAEKAALESEAQTQAVLEAIPDMMFRFAPDGVFLDFKAESGAELMMPPEVFLGKRYDEVLPPPIADPMRDALQRVREGEELVTYEYQAPVPNVGTRSYEARMTSSEGGEIVAIVRDITAEREAAQALEEQEAFLRQIIDSDPNIIFVKDYDSRYVLANKTLADLYGTTPEEMVGKTDAAFTADPGDIAFFQEQDRKTIDEERQVVIPEEKIRDVEGEQHWFQVIKVPLYNREGKADRVLGVGANITERKEAAEALLQERNFSEKIINSLPGIFYMYNQEGELVRWNENFAAVTGYAPEELTSISALDFFEEEERPAIAAVMEQVFVEGQADVEGNLLVKDGATIPYLFTGVRVFVDGQPYLVGVGIDVTEQKAAQAAVQASEARQRAILETTPVGISISKMPEGTVLYANPEFTNILGYDAEAIIDKAAPDFYHDPQETAEVLTLLEANQGVLEDYELRARRADGKVIWISLSLQPIQYGEHPASLAAFVDITERKEAEQALEESAAKLTAIFDSMTDAIAVSDLEGVVTEINDANLEMFRFPSRETVVGKPAVASMVEEDLPRAAANMEKLFELGTTRDEFKMVRTDGTTFDGEITSTVMTDSKGNPTGLIAVTRDITERKQAEVERERFTTQLQTAADIATQASTLLDPQELLEEAVALLKERFDLYHVHVYTLDEEGGELVMQAGSGSAGRAMREQGHTIPLDREESYVATAARTQQAVVVNDVRETPGFMPNPLLPDTVSEVAIPLTIGDQVLGVFDVQDDERDRFTELEMNVFRTLTGQLASALQNALYFEEIQETTERLREVDRLKSEFLANMSHELRTPLNSIIGYSEVMMMGIDGELDPETMEDVKAIYENGQHLLNMINDILDLAKIEAGRMSLNVEPVDLHLLLEELKTTNQGLIHKAKKPIEMKVTVDQSVQTVPADRIRLNQILTNLVGNAIKFTEKGHVHLKAYQHGRHWVCIDVEDTGAGISQDQLEEIFEKFRQADGSAKRQAEGTGLGLAITRSLAQLHGGRIEVDSEPGKGSTFTVWLPAQHNGRDN